jgi:hypothetical protein
MHHPIGVTGLILGTIAALLLLRFQADAHGYLPNGMYRRADGQLVAGTPDGDKRYQFEINGFRFTITLLALSFLLQLVDLLRSP